MKRILAIATNEFLMLVRTKFFIVGLFIVPIFMSAFLAAFRYGGRIVDQADRPFAVVDETGSLYPLIAAAADAHNRDAGDGRDRHGPHFLPALVDPAGRSMAAVEADLAARVKAKDLTAFVEIPADILAPGSSDPVRYYTETTSYQALSSWLSTSFNEQIAVVRLTRAGIDPKLVSSLVKPTRVATFGLTETPASGAVSNAREVGALERLLVPLFFAILMFMAVMSTAQHLINSIIEEKMSKISEVLLGSVTAFQLLMGKLVGVVVVSLLLAVAYLVGAGYTVLAMGRPDLIDVALIAWFFVFLFCATFQFGALFQALSAACSDLKDAQSVLQPAMVVVIASYLTSLIVIRAPESPLSVALSLVPISSPFTMLVRIAMPPGPPFWQIALSITLLAVSTIAVVWAAGRIFRVGLLMQGKPPNLPELLRWIRLR